MALDPDVILDRRLLKRRLTRWRTAAIVAVAALVFLAVERDLGGVFARDHVASIDITGVIVGDDATIRALDDVAHDDRARALIVQIDSPGGTTYGGETLYQAVRAVGAKKPVVAVIGTLGTSAGYLVAIAADHIVAGSTSLTGSIGVLLETAEVSKLLDKVGVSTDTVKSGALKDTPSPFHPMTPAGRAVVQALVDDTYGWFVDVVAERRNLKPDEARRLADGRVYTGRQAHMANLVDQLGAFKEARRWLAETHAIPLDLPQRPVKLPDPGQSTLDWLLGMVKKTLLSERLRLDGLKSLWQPDPR